jgi:membrane protein implicated in regulation of membrane protease activity
VNRNPMRLILVAWIGVGVVRVLLGSSTSPIAYFFFGVFWLISALLLIAAVRQFVFSKKAEMRIEASAICAGLAALFAQGLLGDGDTIAAAAVIFFVSAVILLLIYGRMLRRRAHPIHP